MRRVNLMTLQVMFLVALQVVALVVLWAINPLSQAATDTFALYLSIELVTFAIVSYIYRSYREQRAPNQAWMALGYLSIIILLVSNLALA